MFLPSEKKQFNPQGNDVSVKKHSKESLHHHISLLAIYVRKLEVAFLNIQKDVKVGSFFAVFPHLLYHYNFACSSVTVSKLAHAFFPAIKLWNILF